MSLSHGFVLVVALSGCILARVHNSQECATPAMGSATAELHITWWTRTHYLHSVHDRYRVVRSPALGTTLLWSLCTVCQHNLLNHVPWCEVLPSQHSIEVVQAVPHSWGLCTLDIREVLLYGITYENNVGSACNFHTKKSELLGFALRDFSTTAKHALLLWRRVGYMRPLHAPRTESAFPILFCTWCTVCSPCVSRGLNFAMDKSGKCETYFKKGGPNVGKSFPTEIRREIYVWKLPSLPGAYHIRIFIRNYVERNLPIITLPWWTVSHNYSKTFTVTSDQPGHGRSHIHI